MTQAEHRHSTLLEFWHADPAATRGQHLRVEGYSDALLRETLENTVTFPALHENSFGARSVPLSRYTLCKQGRHYLATWH